MVAVAASYLLALAFYPALGLPARRRIPAGVVLAAGIAVVPWAVPIPSPEERLVVGVWVGVLILKLWDLHLGAERDHRPGWGDMVGFMTNPVFLVHRRKGREPQPGGRRNAAGLLAAALLSGIALWGVYRLVGLDWSGAPFLAEHAAKATAFFVFSTALFKALAGMTRVAGGYAPEPVDRPFRARTPAEFWRRCNRSVGEFLREDVFRPAGGLRHPVRAILAAFAVSGILHEYIFTVATGRIQGYQMAFFLVQGGAVALTLRWKPGPVVGVGSTLAFNLVSSVLFFASFEGMVSFYSEGLPW